MGVNNLFSLLNGKWFIESNYKDSILPLLYAILKKGDFSVEVKEPKKVHYLISHNANGTVKALANSKVSSNQKEPFVAVIPVKNPIYKYSQFCGPMGTKDMMGLMSSYGNNPNCTGIVLDIDSGGGQVAGTAEFYDFIKSFEKPVVAYTDGMMCSAAYYIGSASNHIIANKRCDAIGSIGTVISFVDFRGYYEKQGAKVITAYATKSTDKNKNFEDLLAGKPENYIKNVLDPITEDFHKDMKSARPNLNDDVLSGATYKADKSLELGLIDEIGTLETAIDKVISLSKADKKTNNKNQQLNTKINMANLNVPLIEAILGEKFSDAENETGLLLTDAQAQAIESALAKNKQTSEKLMATETSLNKTNSEVNAVTDAVQKALKNADVENATEMNTVEGVEKLSALVTEYGSLAQKPTNPIAGTDDDETTSNIIGGIDISDAMNN
ncbi:MAG: S49 family peptidase [Tenacibaculum sp.]|nr:S49 family peptidase [Tenacibaculum sp.]